MKVRFLPPKQFMTDDEKAAIVDMIDVLRTLEWSKRQSESGWSSNGFCPVCDNPKFSLHKKTCRLGHAIRVGMFAIKE